MGSRPRKRRSSSSSLPNTLNPEDSTARFELGPLIAALRSGEHVKASPLKSLYAYLMQFSRLAFGNYSSFLDVSCRLDIVELSDVLSKELDGRFQRWVVEEPGEVSKACGQEDGRLEMEKEEIEQEDNQKKGLSLNIILLFILVCAIFIIHLTLCLE